MMRKLQRTRILGGNQEEHTKTKIKIKNMQQLPKLPQILSVVSLDNIGVHG